MKTGKNFLFYVITIGIFTLLMWVVLNQGKHLQYDKIQHVVSLSTKYAVPTTIEKTNSLTQFFGDLFQRLKSPLTVLIIQIIAIIVFSRLLGHLFNKIKQPTVIGEIVAGIILGPSFLGYFFPGVFAFIFPANSLNTLQFISQIGLILFMFLVGMDLDLKVLKKTAGVAVIVSHASIIFPYLLGVILSYFLYVDYAPANVPFIAFALFMGIAMSITAFPVLARIIQERGLTKTPLGSLALTCGAVDDITAWFILAAVIAITKSGSFINSIFTIILSIGYILIMLKVIQPFLRRIGSVYISKEILSKTVLSFLFFTLFLSAYITELIGIHALFGAFIAGVIMPHNTDFKKNIVEKIEDVSLVLLLPLFFAFTGLRTQIGLLNHGHLWLIFLLVLLVAIAGKFGGSSLSARFGGVSWKDSLSLGALMNTRGLMELIVLNIGYDLGILSPEIFAILVLMALITTFMTGPGLNFINFIFEKRQHSYLGKDNHRFKILISFGPPQMGGTLLKLSNFIFPSSETIKNQITAIHLTPSSEIHPTNAVVFEKEGFGPLKATAQELGLKVHTRYKATDEVQNEITRTANKENFDLLLLGSARSVFTENILGGKVRKIINDCNCNTGIFIDRDFGQPKRILALVPPPGDQLFETVLKSLYQNPNVESLSLTSLLSNIEARNDLQNLLEPSEKTEITYIPFNILMNPEHSPRDSYDLMLVSLTGWKMLVNRQTWQIENLPSVLILNQRK
jgi:Kef-type K+ transport system membrane component KefB